MLHLSFGFHYMHFTFTLSYQVDNFTAVFSRYINHQGFIRFVFFAIDFLYDNLWLTNSHTFKTVATTVRWRAAGGKDLTDQFYPGPNSVREIGCAAEAEIVEAKFADF